MYQGARFNLVTRRDLRTPPDLHTAVSREAWAKLRAEPMILA